MAKKTTAQRIAKEALQTEYILLMQIEKLNPELAERLKPAFREYAATVRKMIKEDPTCSYMPSDIERRIPGNEWIRMMKELHEDARGRDN